MIDKEKLNETEEQLTKLKSLLRSLKFIERSQYEEKQNKLSRVLFQRLVDQKHEQQQKKNQREEKLIRVKLQLGITSKQKYNRQTIEPKVSQDDETNFDPQELAQNLEEFKDLLINNKTLDNSLQPEKLQPEKLPYRRKSSIEITHYRDRMENQLETQPIDLQVSKLQREAILFEEEKQRAMDTLQRARQFLYKKNLTKNSKKLFDKKKIDLSYIKQITDIPDIFKNHRVIKKKKKFHRPLQQEKLNDKDELEKQKIKILEKLKTLGLNINQSAPFNVLQVCKLMKNSQFGYSTVSQDFAQATQNANQFSNQKSYSQPKIQEGIEKMAKSSSYYQQVSQSHASSSPFRKQRRTNSIFSSLPKTPIPLKNDIFQLEYKSKLQETQNLGDQIKISLSRTNKYIKKLQKSINQDFKELLSQA